MKKRFILIAFVVICMILVIIGLMRVHDSYDDVESINSQTNGDLSITIESIDLSDEQIQQIQSYPTKHKIEFNNLEYDLLGAHAALIDDLSEVQDYFGGDLLMIAMQKDVSKPYLFWADDSYLELISPLMEAEGIKCVLTVKAFYGDEDYTRIYPMGMTEKGDECFTVNSSIGEIECIKTETRTTAYAIHNHCLYMWEIYSNDKDRITNIMEGVYYIEESSDISVEHEIYTDYVSQDKIVNSPFDKSTVKPIKPM